MRTKHPNPNTEIVELILTTLNDSDENDNPEMIIENLLYDIEKLKGGVN